VPLGKLKNTPYLAIGMDSLKFASRYSFMPPRLNPSLHSRADEAIFKFACGTGDRKAIEKTIESIPGIKLYLGLIAKKHQMDRMDFRVLEAYWLGNDLLTAVSAHDIRTMILEDFLKKGLDKNLAQEMAKKVPEGAVPHHSFHVMHIRSVMGGGVSYADVGGCMIRPGRVESVMEDHILIDDGKRIKYDRQLLPGLMKGDLIAHHWGLAIDKITPAQANNLQKYNQHSLKLMKGRF
jgi:hypothetical protein